MSTTVRDAAPTARVAVIERRGKFLVAEPFFESGPRVVVSRDRRFSVGDLVVLRPPRGVRGGRDAAAGSRRAAGRGRPSRAASGGPT